MRLHLDVLEEMGLSKDETIRPNQFLKECFQEMRMANSKKC